MFDAQQCQGVQLKCACCAWLLDVCALHAAARADTHHRSLEADRHTWEEGGSSSEAHQGTQTQGDVDAEHQGTSSSRPEATGEIRTLDNAWTAEI